MSLTTLFKAAKDAGITLDKDAFTHAYNFAAKAHEGQLRYSGDPYIIHPEAVAMTLIDWGMPQAVIIAALLHDTVEDNPTITLDMIHKEFGQEVAFLVANVTKVGSVRLRNSRKEFFVENLRKMFVAMAQDIRVVMIRLADRLHNMRTLDAIPISKQKRIAKETLQVYAPLAQRLGIGYIKGELEDLAFPYIYPRSHQKVIKLASPHYEHSQEVIDTLINQITEKITGSKISATVHGRRKHYYSLFRKLKRLEIGFDIDKINDLIALRIITDTKMNCYAILGIIHSHWKPAPHIGVSDFIAQPKPNGYQSIHTKIFDKHGRIVEVQIRTAEMHQQAEYGAAAHFAYSEAKEKNATSKQLDDGFTLDKKIFWVKQLATWQQEVKSTNEFVHSLKLDVLSTRIYVFSPKGDVFDLPFAATPIDFAFAVHSDLGLYLQSAKVNGKLVALSYPLDSGDVVEILKSKAPHKPTRDWLKFVKTSKARNKILHVLNELDSHTPTH